MKLFKNKRFWILVYGLLASLFFWGLVQQFVPPGKTQEIRLQQIYGFVSFLLISFVLMTSFINKIVKKPKIVSYLNYIRRPLGVLAFYFALLHAVIGYFVNLGGIEGIKFLDNRFLLATIFGFIALIILAVLTSVSFDKAVSKFGIKRWLKINKLVYLALFLASLHFVLIGTHFSSLNVYSLSVYIMLISIIVYELYRRMKK